MDGIFGVGIAEVIMIGLVLFIIGGPENTAKWARELGRWARKGRQAWADAMAQIEKELGDDGKEIVDAAREVGKEVRSLRSATSSRGLVRSALQSDLGLETDLAESFKPIADKPEDKNESPETVDSASDKTPEAAEMVAGAVDNADDETERSSHSTYTAWLPPDHSTD